MMLVTLVLLVVLMPFSAASTRMEQEPLSTYRWTHRLLVMDVPDTELGREALDALRQALDAQMKDVLERDLLIVPVGDLPRAGERLRPSVDLDAGKRASVRRRLGLQGQEAQIVLIGKDGGVKARQSAAFDLDALLALIDRMPMRRSEAERR